MDTYKYIDAPKPELYDLQEDPAERSNIVLANPAEARALRSELAKLLASHARPTPAQTSAASPQTEKLLNSLGYVAPGPRTRTGTAGPDPKDRLPEYLLYQKSMEAVKQRRLNTAVAILRQILAGDSTNTLARRDLASCYLDLHDDAKARADFEKVVAAAPDDYASQFGLGLADQHLGLLNDARAHIESACRLAPQAVQCQHELDELKQGSN
jgi:tetratricopeptide (TPR) repeat protein